MDTEHYVMACYRYIELNPVRAGMVVEPESYRWSSFAANTTAAPDTLVTPHDVYLRLAEDVVLRRNRYRELVAQALSEDDLAAIRLYVQRQRALGSNRFQEQIEKQLQRRVGLGRPGRPSKRTVL